LVGVLTATIILPEVLRRVHHRRRDEERAHDDDPAPRPLILAVHGVMLEWAHRPLMGPSGFRAGYAEALFAVAAAGWLECSRKIRTKSVPCKMHYNSI
jgi:hypothetical protein